MANESEFKFIDYTQKVLGSMDGAMMAALEEAAGELEAQVKRNTAVDTGQTKNSWTHQVQGDEHKGVATVGSPMENAIWEEFGTGEYALHGNGRKGGWFYEDAEGNGHFTHGKRPRRPFQKAYDTMKPKIIRRLQGAFKGGLK